MSAVDPSDSYALSRSTAETRRRVAGPAATPRRTRGRRGELAGLRLRGRHRAQFASDDGADGPGKRQRRGRRDARGSAARGSARTTGGSNAAYRHGSLGTKTIVRAIT